MCASHFARTQAVVALITSDVHSRDVVGSLVQRGTSSVSDFAWQVRDDALMGPRVLVFKRRLI